MRATVVAIALVSAVLVLPSVSSAEKPPHQPRGYKAPARDTVNMRARTGPAYRPKPGARAIETGATSSTILRDLVSATRKTPTIPGGAKIPSAVQRKMKRALERQRPENYGIGIVEGTLVRSDAKPGAGGKKVFGLYDRVYTTNNGNAFKPFETRSLERAKLLPFQRSEYRYLLWDSSGKVVKNDFK